MFNEAIEILKVNADKLNIQLSQEQLEKFRIIFGFFAAL